MAKTTAQPTDTGAAICAGEPAKARILLVDDHPVVRQGLAQFVNQEPDLVVCGETGSPEEALTLATDLNPDIAVIDLSLGNASGIVLLKDLLERRPSLRVLILSMHDESLHAERALRAGARGYIMKEEATDRVVQAIRKVLAGEIHLSERMASRLLARIFQGHGGEEASPVERLSDRELEVFELIGHGHGTREIAGMLKVSVKTIESHRAHIKRKLMLRNAIDLIQQATQWVNDGDVGTRD